MTSQSLQEHLEQEHKKSPLTENLREVVYGGIDGIITTFAVVAGFSGAVMLGGENGLSIPIAAVVLFGLANLLADGFSMGIGDYLSTRSEAKLYAKEKAKELHEIADNTQFEYDECIDILEKKGLSTEDAHTIMGVYQKYPDFWAEFMMRYELEMPLPEERPIRGALTTFVSFLVFGSIPLIPYILGFAPENSFVSSCIFSAGALIVLGTLRARVTREGYGRSLLETVGLGIVAALIAYSVGTFFA